MTKAIGLILAMVMLTMLVVVLYTSWHQPDARNSFYNGTGLGFGIGFGLVLGTAVFNWLIGFLDRLKSGKL